MHSIKYYFLVLILICSAKNIQAQIPVREEPHHKTVLLNDYVRLIDVHLNPKPVTHRVYNSGDSVFHVMDIELVKKEPSADSCAALQQSNIETTINEKLVRVYKFDVSNQTPFNMQKSSCAHLLICISGEIHTSNKKLATGDFAFFDPNTAIAISSQQNNNATCVMLELK
jgi:hypothetical protein